MTGTSGLLTFQNTKDARKHFVVQDELQYRIVIERDYRRQYS
jgi:hypothetical protein